MALSLKMAVFSAFWVLAHAARGAMAYTAKILPHAPFSSHVRISFPFPRFYDSKDAF